MECNKCKVEVPAQFEFALSKNICPKCGSKLMVDIAMKTYLDLKKRLHEVEFVMDKNTVCERIAMFIVMNYQVGSLSSSSSIIEKTVSNNDKMKQLMAGLDEEEDLTAEEIREQEAVRADEIAAAREMGIDIEDEELISGKSDDSKIERLKRLAISSKAGGIVRRSDS